MGQGLLVHRYTEELARHGLTAGQVLLTLDDVTRRRALPQRLPDLRAAARARRLPIVNENDTVATSEIRFGDNDRLAALVAHLVHADLLVLLDVDGLYDGPAHVLAPRLIPRCGPRPTSTPCDRCAGAAGVGTGGMLTKVEAARIATGAGIPVVLTSAEHRAGRTDRRPGRHALPRRRAAAGPPGCCGCATPPRPRARWCSTPARRAVVERRASCWPQDHRRDRKLRAGDPVDLIALTGVPSAGAWST